MWDWALDLAELSGGEAVVEVGCGNGQYLRSLRERNHLGVIIGLDLSPGMAEAARLSGALPVGVEVLAAAETLSRFAAATVHYGIAVERAALAWFDAEPWKVGHD